MTFESSQVNTVLTDSFTTLVHQLSTPEVFEGYTDDPEEAARIWGTRATRYGLVGTMLGEFRSCREKYEKALDYTIERLEIDVPESEREEMLSPWENRPAFDDVPPGLERLTDAGYEVYVLSNGDHDMLDDMIESAGIDDYVSGTISASDVGFYKPDPRLYRHAAVQTGTPVTEIAHVTASWNDVLGAMHTGMQGVWLNRDDRTWEDILGDADLEVNTFHEFADTLGD
ncbi:haloacid dehalogenase [Haloterrigena salina JCM 13891]|uniref:Haloacid dehalogenase n=1 Tax=Haloterrigena salina JCM 13891 TaxID=1227488 RepID=M0CPT7_9EURY|nr:haloacid dehalogenase type II [Haloterrigena salina]ELZ24633.1 haloacid dehalogenase [Haloterrigena salina JCM 13891]